MELIAIFSELKITRLGWTELEYLILIFVNLNIQNQTPLQGHKALLNNLQYCFQWGRKKNQDLSGVKN